eukprot:2437266-Pyramimonas_sp.AAC.1
MGAGDPTLLEAGCPATGPESAASWMNTGVFSHVGLVAMVKAVDPSASAATPHSSTLIARCPD